MCIICVSPRGIPQPTEKQIRAMFSHNPHGAGFMLATGRDVKISKGYMDVADLLHDTRNFTSSDVVVWHFRISTQAGVTPEMTQPFPLVASLDAMTKLEYSSAMGVAHNGIIPITSNGSRRYSDTALFVARYMPRLIRYQKDLHDRACIEMLEELIHSKMVILDKAGFIALVGSFIREDNGLLFSNGSYQPRTFTSPHGKIPDLQTSFLRRQV